MPGRRLGNAFQPPHRRISPEGGREVGRTL